MSTSTKPNTAAYQLHPIGNIRNVEGSFQLEIFEPFKSGLKELSRFSHVMVFWWAHHHDNTQDRAIVTTPLPYAGGMTAGVFACRSPYRPNPIGFTIMNILYVDVEKGIVSLPWIDADDGTPLLDIKPYIPVSERVRDVQVAEWFSGWPQWMEDAGEFFANNQIDFGE